MVMTFWSDDLYDIEMKIVNAVKDGYPNVLEIKYEDSTHKTIKNVTMKEAKQILRRIPQTAYALDIKYPWKNNGLLHIYLAEETR